MGDVLGPRLVADTGEWGAFAWTEFILGTPGMRIAGGSDDAISVTVNGAAATLDTAARVFTTASISLPGFIRLCGSQARLMRRQRS